MTMSNQNPDSNDRPDSNEHPELNGYVPSENYRPLRGKRFKLMIRIVVVVGIVALVVPGIFTTVQVASATASNTCRVAVGQYYPTAVAYDARWEMIGAGGLGWQCYALDPGGREIFVVPLGLIPSAPKPLNPGSPS
ncbi:MAG: hypothetical protein R6W83_05275 [Cryobacterium sp.]